MKKTIKSNETPTIYGTGLVALDIVLNTDINRPTYNWAGGTCGNVVTILSYLGWSAFPIARLNEESSSIRVKSDLKKWGVRLDFSELAPSASVPVITQEISRDKRGLAVHKFHWRSCPKCGSWLPNYKPVTLQAVNLVKERVNGGEVYFFDRTSPGALDLARHFKELGCVIFFEPSAKGDPKHFKEAVKLADIIKYSDPRFSSILTSSTNTHTPILEIHTLGENGLRYRLNNQRTWRHLAAFEAVEVNDTCGCGDWTTAGVISHLCSQGYEGLFSKSNKSIELALKYGQALGAWNCSFEGARSGMYQIDKRAFCKEIELILREGTRPARTHTPKPNLAHASDGLCPACPP